MRQQSDHPLGGIERDEFGWVIKQRSGDGEPTMDGMTATWELLAELYERAIADGDGGKAQELWVKLKEVEGWLANWEEPQKIPRKPRGYHGITTRGKRMVRSGCTLLEQRHGKKCLAFFTATLPNLPEAEMLILIKHWSEIVRRFDEELGRELKRQGLNPQLVGVTEIQEKRFAKEGLAIPHLHLLFQGRHRGQHWAISPEWFRQKWEAVIANILDKPIDLPAATRVEPVKKSPSNYMSKYMSKGGKILKEIHESEQPCKLPSAWWHMTDTLRAEIKEKTITVYLRQVDLDGLLEWINQAIDLIYANCYFLEESGRTVALYGRCRANQIDRFLKYVLSYAGLDVISAVS